MAQYDGSSIKVLKGLEAVVKRPGMYIGSTDGRGLHHLVWEIVDNAIDEALNGYGKEISVIIHQDNSISVIDNGRGIPVDVHETGKSTPEVIFTTLHAGGKFGDGGYKTSGGLHGVGSSVVNALSTKLEVQIKKDGYLWQQTFLNNGSEVSSLEQIKAIKGTGTTVHFYPDSNIFSETTYSYKQIAKRLRESAFLISGLKMKLFDERTNQADEFFYEEGIQAFLEFLVEGKKEVIKPITFKDEVDDKMTVEVGLTYSDVYNEEVLSFVNNVSTKDGGTHEVGFKIGLTKILNDLAKDNGLIKTKEKKLEGTDVREGLVAIISIKIREDLLQFEGQTKSKLGTPEARGYIETLVYNKLKLYFDQNIKQLEIIIKKALSAKMAREAAKKSRQEARNKAKNKKDIAMSGKLTPAQTKKIEEKELFLVEGDSAGGSAKQGRNRYNQAILPLKGKVVNTEKARVEDILKNEELGTIVNILGAGIGHEFKIEDLKYGKVVIMTDADQDGAHIQILLLTFFYRYMRPLIEAGRVYIALPPLYKVATMDNKKVEYAWEEDELEPLTKTFKKKYYVQRYKGLGEMDAKQLWETTMDPEHRMFLKVTIDDIVESEKEIVTLMGEDVKSRREWIEANIDFYEEDSYEIANTN
ncbi:MAG: DNA topoisomerase IV subunit B [Mycoplasmatales bacterium]